MMLQKIKIERFKSARDIELDFGRVNLFIGGNGAGKSNIIESIGLLAAALNRGVSDVELSRKGVRLTPATLMKSAFKNYSLPKTLRLEAKFSHDITYDIELSSGVESTSLSFRTEKSTCNGSKIFGRSGAGSNVLQRKITRKLDNHRSLWDQTRSAFDFSEDIQNTFDSMAQFAIYAPQTEFLREIKSGVVSDPPIGLHGEGLSSAVSTLLIQYNEAYRNEAYRKRAKKPSSIGEGFALDLAQMQEALKLFLLPGWAEEVRAEALNPLLKSSEMSASEGKVVFFLDRFMHEGRNTLSSYDSSEGTLYLLFIAILLCHAESPKIFAIDNIDNALNPLITRKVIEAMISIIKRKKGTKTTLGPNQVFLTSHNPSSLDAFDLFDEDLRVFVVKRDDKGHTITKPLKPRKGWTKNDWDEYFQHRKLSHLWIDGEIKGALGIDEVEL